MNMQLVVGGIVILALAVGGYWFLEDNSGDMMQKDAMMTEGEQQEKMMEDSNAGAMQDDAMMEKDAMMEDESAMEGAMMKKGSYENYSPEKLASAQQGDVLLYFHADWCPICRPLDAEFRAQEASLGDVTILKVNYDTETALKQKYGVTLQHTFVQVDASGKMIAKWSDTSTLEGVLAKVK